jgi:hypothetical protein
MSRLEESSIGYRKTNIARNDFDNNDQYSVGHPDALSTGDENGKGEVNGRVGGTTDIKQRECLAAKNCYNKNREYNAGTA